jgi:hypothetical protein
MTYPARQQGLPTPSRAASGDVQAASAAEITQETEGKERGELEMSEQARSGGLALLVLAVFMTAVPGALHTVLLPARLASRRTAAVRALRWT